MGNRSTLQSTFPPPRAREQDIVGENHPAFLIVIELQHTVLDGPLCCLIFYLLPDVY